MSVAVRILTPEQRRQANRQAALLDLISYAVGEHLSPEGERRIREPLMRKIEPLLELADWARAAREEYEAVEQRLSRHYRTHVRCLSGEDCAAKDDLRRQRDRLMAISDRAERDLIRGRR